MNTTRVYCGLLMACLVSCATPPPKTGKKHHEAAAIADSPDTLRGRVLDPEGQPVAGAQVALMTSFDWMALGPISQLAHTDERGEFSIKDLPAGLYGATASAPGKASTSAGNWSLDGMKVNEPLTIRLEYGGFEVTGTVVDEQGVPIPHAHVEALEVWPEDARPAHVTISDDVGRYALRLLGPTPYLLAVSTPNRRRTYRRIDPTAQDVAIALAPPAAPRPDDEVLRSWLETHALAIEASAPSRSLADLEPLRAVIGSARVVALGEATHGSAELFHLKHRVVQLLVERMGFTTIAFEVGYAEALAVDAYVHGGKGSAEEVVRGLVTDPFATKEIVDLVRWMRSYNQHARHPKKISFVGFDMTTWSSVEAVSLYLKQVGLEKPSTASALVPLATFAADSVYASASPEQRSATKMAIDNIIETLETKRETLTAKTGAAAFDVARNHARILRQAERSFRDPTLRDTLMAENVNALVSRDPNARIALWLHNAHATAWPMSFEDMGRRLRETHGEDYFVLGTAFGSGGLRALSGKNMKAGPRAHQLAAPPLESFNAALGLAEPSCYAIDLRTARGAVRDWLISPVPTWSVGFAFHGREVAAQPIPPALAFDAVVYIDRVTAAHELRKKSRATPGDK